MKKILTRQSGYALMVVLVAIVVIGLLTPVMLTAATYGLKNTKSTNDNLTARYNADSAYQVNWNKINNKREEGELLSETAIKNYMNDDIINSSGTLNDGHFITKLHTGYPINPKIKKDTSTTEYTYYLRSIGEVKNQTSYVDYKIVFTISTNGTIILYEKSNKEHTFDNLPTYPDNLKKIAEEVIGLNETVQDDINKKFDGSSPPNISFKYDLSPKPNAYQVNELTETVTIQGDAKVSKVNLKNNKSLKVDGDLYVENDFTVGNNVSVTIDGDLYIGTNFNIGNNAKLIVTGDVIAKNSIKFNNNIHYDIGGSVFVQGEFTVENNASNSKIGKSLYVKNNINLENNGELYVANDIVGNNVNLKNNNYLKTGGEVLVKNEFEAKNNAEIELEGGLEVGTQLKLSNNVEFKFAKKLYITNNLDIKNNTKMLLLNKDGTGGGSSVSVDINYHHLPE